jgi:hypothetical protein
MNITVKDVKKTTKEHKEMSVLLDFVHRGAIHHHLSASLPLQSD